VDIVNVSSVPRDSIISQMQTLPANIYSVASVREIDRTAIEDHGIPGYTLMTRAGTASLREAKDRFPDAKRWQIVCGAGNNGGDGYVVARLAANEGIVVSVLTMVDPQSLKGDAATAYGDFAAEGGVVMPWAGELDMEADLLVDAILGSGLERDVGGEYAKAVEAINEHVAPVLALDIPTGIHGDSGSRLGCAVDADLTVTFVGLKTGLFLDGAPDSCGELSYDGLGIPDEWRSVVDPEFRRIDDALMHSALPPRKRAAHKGDFGHLVLVAGSVGKSGAAILAARAAVRSGAGLVTAAVPQDVVQTVDLGSLESMSLALPAAVPDGLEASCTDLLLDFSKDKEALAVGPGLGLAPSTVAAVRRLVLEVELPVVLDADGLNAFAGDLATLASRTAGTVLTPHPGELGRLLGCEVSQVQEQRIASAKQDMHGLEECFKKVCKVLSSVSCRMNGCFSRMVGISSRSKLFDTQH